MHCIWEYFILFDKKASRDSFSRFRREVLLGVLCKNDIFPPRVLFYLNRIKFLKNEPVIEILYWSITAPLICSGTVRTVLSEPIPSQDFQSHYACTFRWSAFNSETVSQHYLRIIQLTTAAADCTILFADYIRVQGSQLLPLFTELSSWLVPFCLEHFKPWEQYSSNAK